MESADLYGNRSNISIFDSEIATPDQDLVGTDMGNRDFYRWRDCKRHNLEDTPTPLA